MKSGLIGGARLNEIRTVILGMHATKDLTSSSLIQPGGRRLHKHASVGLGSLASEMRRAEEK